ncbi:hypothetical protein QQZ08_004798 [Neonectria magnoliae]|uniref:ubiquitinyl hydrolase 1 n=1 Tax=Neonectria magnoliae TaxID=2732573 RepID=A0ABR1I6Q7_9HYPO
MPASTITISDAVIMAHSSETDQPPQGIETRPTQTPPRRSSRLASRLAVNPQKVRAVSATMSEPSRNPKRKASEAAKQATQPVDRLLDEALAPLTSRDVEEWQGWIELESEPAFFNIILRDLGVKNIKAQEIFTVDQDSLDMLPSVFSIWQPSSRSHPPGNLYLA